MMRHEDVTDPLDLEIEKREAELQGLKERRAQQMQERYARDVVLPQIVGNLRSYVSEVRAVGHLNVKTYPLNVYAANELAKVIPDLWADTLASVLTMGAFYGLWEFAGNHNTMGFGPLPAYLHDFDVWSLEEDHPLRRACEKHIWAAKILSVMMKSQRDLTMGLVLSCGTPEAERDTYFRKLQLTVRLGIAFHGADLNAITKGIITADDIRHYDKVLVPNVVHRDYLDCEDSMRELIAWFDTRYKRFDETYP